MANEIYIGHGTPVIWTDTTGTLALTLNGLAAGAGRVGARTDLSLAGSAWPEEYNWRVTLQFQTAAVPAVGETVDCYISTSDGTEPDGQVGVADAALATPEHLSNLLYIGSVIADVNTASTKITGSGVCRITTKYASPVLFNNTAGTLIQTNDISSFTLTPIFSQGQ